MLFFAPYSLGQKHKNTREWPKQTPTPKSWRELKNNEEINLERSASIAEDLMLQGI